MYGKDDTKIIVYNMRKWPRKRGLKYLEQKNKKKINKYITKRRTLDSWLNYFGYVEDDFYISYSYFFFKSTHDRYFISRIRLVLFPTLYKFIVWACWFKTQSYLGFKSKLVLTVYNSYICTVQLKTTQLHIYVFKLYFV